MGIRCIALDLDRTTLNERGRLSEPNRMAIEEAIRQGIEVVVASGRAFQSFPEDVCAISGIQYAITSNGAAVYELHTGRCLIQYKMTAKSVQKILNLTRMESIAYEVFIDGKPYGQQEYVEDPVKYGATPAAVPYVQRTREPVENIEQFILEHQMDLDSMDLVVKDEETKNRLWKLLNDQVEDLYITSSIRQLLEISYKDSGKHSGVAFILSILGLDRDELAAFGDGDNDADLLQFAGVGYAMENASPACKAAADRITSSNAADGVAVGIMQLLKDNLELRQEGII